MKKSSELTWLLSQMGLIWQKWCSRQVISKVLHVESVILKNTEHDHLFLPWFAWVVNFFIYLSLPFLSPFLFIWMNWQDNTVLIENCTLKYSPDGRCLPTSNDSLHSLGRPGMLTYTIDNGYINVLFSLMLQVMSKGLIHSATKTLNCY